MKKLIALSTSVIIALGIGVLFAGCGETPEPEHKTHYDVNADGDCDVCGEMMPGHEHILSLGWKTTDNEHWRTATCHDGTEVQRGEHQFYNDKCKVCAMAEPLTRNPEPYEGWYHLQAEHALLEDPVGVDHAMVVETGRHEYTPDDTLGEEVADVGYFGGSASRTGQTITWKFTSDKAVTIKIKLRASSAVGDWGSRHIEAIALDEDGAPTLSFNGDPLDVTGKVIGVTKDYTQAEMQSNEAYCNFNEIEFEVELVAGENVFVLTSGEKGCNPDKLLVEAGDYTITFVKTDNSDRI